MSFDYPPSQQSVIVGQDFYRIRAPLSIFYGTIKQKLTQNFSIGDLAPVDSPIAAIAVGPDSDFYRYEVIYPDSLTESSINRSLLTPVNPFVLPTNGVDLSSPYAGTEQLKKVFLRGLDWLYGTGSFDFPIIDLIVYTKGPPTQFPTLRNPKRYILPLQLFSAQDNSIFVPIFGRNEVSVRLSLNSALAAASVSWEIEGANYLGVNPVGGQDVGDYNRFLLQASAAVPAGTPQPLGSGFFYYTPAAFGRLDELRIRITSDTDFDPSSANFAFLNAILDIEMRD
jgi:hypothetical protein